MTDVYFRTIIYLDSRTRQRLEAYANEQAASISQAARRILADRLHDELTLSRADWFMLAMQLLLRHHPGQNLESVLASAQQLAKSRRWE
jgi:hypothetical protein